MANNSSLGSASNSFDFDTQSGVMHVLASVRASDISATQKNELRDLVFLYSNGGHDNSVRNNLEQKMAQFSVVALPKTTTAAQPKIHEFGASRPAPAFKAAPVHVTRKPVGEKEVPTGGQPHTDAVSMVKSTPTPTPAPATVTEPVVTSASVDDLQNLPPENAITDAAETESPVDSVSPPSQNTAGETQADSLGRIKEIKALVNQKVGNPVNLVDINNEVGREYMGALLDAMKKINSGSSAASAMQRLETAYSSVEETLKNQPQATTEPVAKNIPQPQPQPAPVPAVAQPSSEPDQKPESAATKFSPVSSAGELQMDSRPLTPLAQSEKNTATEPTQVTPATNLPPVPRSSVEPEEPQQEPGSAWGPETDTVAKATPKKETLQPSPEPSNEQQVGSPAKYQSTSLAQSETKLRTPEDLPVSSALETSSVAGDPLYTKQVDDGLNQLLSDWTLFKKSGLFGTGPKGMSHPLYIMIKDLQIPLLLAGRFEGATQEIKQSITDYMNGWRYEQGIVYEQGENFDHYLRRVIRHILDLQQISKA